MGDIQRIIVIIDNYSSIHELKLNQITLLGARLVAMLANHLHPVFRSLKHDGGVQKPSGWQTHWLIGSPCFFFGIWIPIAPKHYQLSTGELIQKDQLSNPFGGFLKIGDTPSYHPFWQGFPLSTIINHPFWGTPNYHPCYFPCCLHEIDHRAIGVRGAGLQPAEVYLSLQPWPRNTQGEHADL